MISCGTSTTSKSSSATSATFSPYLSVGDRKRDVERLVSALAEIHRRYKRDKTGMLTQEYIPPNVVITPQAAFYAPKESVPLREARGRICSEFIMFYPAGHPDSGAGGNGDR